MTWRRMLLEQVVVAIVTLGLILALGGIFQHLMGSWVHARGSQPTIGDQDGK